MSSSEALEGIRQYLEALDHLSQRYLKNGAVQSPHRFMLDNGQAFRVTEATFAGKRGVPKQCYSNAGQIALGSSELQYAEGYVTSIGIPIHHAWLVNRHGEVIDPTLRDNDPDFGGRAYFGLVFNKPWYSRALVRSGYWSMLDDMGPALRAIVKGETEGMLALRPSAAAE